MDRAVLKKLAKSNGYGVREVAASAARIELACGLRVGKSKLVNVCYGKASSGCVNIGPGSRLWWDAELFFPSISDTSVDLFSFGQAFTCFDTNVAHAVLCDVLRTLKRGGRVSITVPDFCYIASTLDTKFFAAPWLVNKWLYGDICGKLRRAAYSYPILASMLQEIGYTRITKVICPLRALASRRPNRRNPLDRFIDFPRVMMTVEACKPENDSEPAFVTLEELSPGILKRALAYHGRRLQKIEKEIR